MSSASIIFKLRRLYKLIKNRIAIKVMFVVKALAETYIENSNVAASIKCVLSP